MLGCQRISRGGVWGFAWGIDDDRSFLGVGLKARKAIPGHRGRQGAPAPPAAPASGGNSLAFV
ncbi:MAG: hypothetical protein Kow0054_23800 [Deferrisoma sp.]